MMKNFCRCGLMTLVVLLAACRTQQQVDADDEVPAGQQWLMAHKETQTAADRQVAASVGHVIRVWDAGYLYRPYGDSLGAEMVFSEEYVRHIKRLPISSRVDFFVSVLIHRPMDAHYLEEFIETAHRDCGAELIAALDKMIENGKDHGIDDQTVPTAIKFRRMLAGRN